jgi:hypothetical protein
VGTAPAWQSVSRRGRGRLPWRRPGAELDCGATCRGPPPWLLGSLSGGTLTRRMLIPCCSPCALPAAHSRRPRDDPAVELPAPRRRPPPAGGAAGAGAAGRGGGPGRRRLPRAAGEARLPAADVWRVKGGCLRPAWAPPPPYCLRPPTRGLPAASRVSPAEGPCIPSSHPALLYRSPISVGAPVPRLADRWTSPPCARACPSRPPATPPTWTGRWAPSAWPPPPRRRRCRCGRGGWGWG